MSNKGSCFDEYRDLIVMMLAQGATTISIAQRLGSETYYEALKSYIYKHGYDEIRNNARHGLHYKEYFRCRKNG